MADAEQPSPVRTRRPPPPLRRVAVRSTEALSPRMQRIVVGGDDMAGFPQPEPAASVRLLLPPGGDAPLVLPTWTGNLYEYADGTRAPMRTLTPRSWNPDELELTLDVVLHGDGPLARWAGDVGPGAETAISGPAAGYDIPAAARSFLLVGDESAVPAMFQLLEHLPSSVSVDVHVEVTESGTLPPVPGHAGATIREHVLSADAAPGSTLLPAVASADPLPEAIWVAGEAAGVQAVRRHLFDDAGIPRARASVRGYWKHGRGQP